MPSLALIINTFQQAEYLRRVLAAVSAQTSAPNEVLLADDGSGQETRATFESWARTQDSKTAHLWQPHEGFRRASILNASIARAQAEYIVFLDGDTIPHPRFVADHQQAARKGFFVQGHRALLKQKAAAWFGTGEFRRDRRRAFLCRQIQGWKHAFRWPWPVARTRLDLRGIRGCNLAVWREDLARVNGYNEAFVGWGREDSELAVRLMNLGTQRLDLRGRALCVHLWHPPASREGLATNDDLLAHAQSTGATRCQMGLHQHETR
jgi:glycosyltransferase involved in cell wall biosynthesis